MEYKKIKNNKGITLIALVLTIVISILLIVGVSASFTNISDTQDYYKKKEDIIALTKATQSYYLKTGELPISIDKIKKDGGFNRLITQGEAAKDRNPNDNDIYYVIYDTKTDDIDCTKDYLKEVNIRSTESTYVINEKSLTVYCVQGYILDGKMHYTASEDFSGGKFASEYYKDVGIMDAKMNISIDTGTVININGQDISYSKYAHRGSNITLTLDISSTDFYDINGKKVDITFDSFESQPKASSFLMKIEPFNGGAAYVENVPASSISYSSDKKHCSFIFNLASYNTDSWANRRKITFSYNDKSDICYNEDNRIDYKAQIDNYFKMNIIEFDNNEDEIILASEMRKASGMDHFAANIKNIKTNNQSGSLTNWNHYYSYTNVITTASGQKYVMSDLNDFQKAYTLKLKYESNPTEIPRNGVSVDFTLNGQTITQTSGYSIDAVPGTEIVTKSKSSGYNTKTMKYTIGNVNLNKTITLKAKIYTFTLTSNTAGSTVELSNTTHPSIDSDGDGVADGPTGDTSSQTRTVSAYYKDNIAYNVKKDFYRFSNEVGKSSSTKNYTMGAGNKTENITLAQNIVTPKQYEISHVGINYATKSKSKTGYGTIGYNSYVTKVDLLFTLYHSNALKSDKVEFKFTNQPLLSNKVYSGLSKGKAYNVDYSYNLYTYGGAFPPPDTNVINNDNNNVAATLTTGGLESADLKKIYIKVTYAVR